ncbi:MAG: hypothetical protein ACR2PX_03570 [Endozoicomonas sp.]|uniref:hypothetical protein n=1 Tax=Endozoicomonas sp. TaxID=1892382 RepID=UPI003D9AB9D1
MRPMAGLLSGFVFFLMLSPMSGAQSFNCRLSNSNKTPCPTLICPDNDIVITCDVGDTLGHTVWGFPAGTCKDENNEIILLQFAHADCAGNTNSRCPGFTAVNLVSDNNANCSVSTLTIDTNSVADGIRIECINVPFIGSEITVGNVSLEKWSDDQRVVRNADPATFNSNHFNLVWQNGILEDQVDQYELGIIPPVENCNSSCIVNGTVGNFNFTGLDQESYNLTLTFNDPCNKPHNEFLHISYVPDPGSSVISIVMPSNTSEIEKTGNNHWFIIGPAVGGTVLVATVVGVTMVITAAAYRHHQKVQLKRAAAVAAAAAAANNPSLIAAAGNWVVKNIASFFVTKNQP